MNGSDTPHRLPRLERLRSVRQLCDEFPHLFTEGSLRWQIWRGAETGFDVCVVRIGRRVLIDTDRLREWLAGQGRPVPRP